MKRILALSCITALLLPALALAQHGPSWQYKWWVWLPSNWQALGACETGYGKRPGNWKHANSRYVSAFGIQRGSFAGAYDHDAKMAGMPPWNDAHPPTPWQQYRTALMHYRLYGDGWGCSGP